MTETPDVSADVVDEVIDRLAMLLPLVPWKMVDEQRRAVARARALKIVAHLRAHPEDAAAVLGGEVERKIRGTTNGDLWHSAISPTESDVPVARVVGPWREVPTSEEAPRG